MFPEKQPKKRITIEMESEKLERIKTEARRRNITIRSLFEYGMSLVMKEIEEQKEKKS